MAYGLNNFTGTGRLARDPEIRYSTAGKAWAKVAIAFDSGKDKNGEDHASFINVIFFGKTAENLEKFSGKGKRVTVVGFLKQEMWEKNGERRYAVNIVCEKLSIVDFKDSEGGRGGSQSRSQSSSSKPPSHHNESYGAPEEEWNDDDDDIPF